MLFEISKLDLIKGHWSAEERQKIVTGVEEFGIGKWEKLLKIVLIGPVQIMT